MRHIIPITITLLILASAGMAMDGMLFDHDAHLKEAESNCGACHLDTDMDIVPAMVVCEECHEESFLSEARIPATTTHDSFWYRDHGPYSKDQDNNCAACHQEEFCFQCHGAGFPDEQGALNVHTGDFRVTHPIRARADNRSCTVCHDPSYCTDCHSDFEPEDLAFESHRRGWSEIPTGGGPHILAGTDQCGICHTDSVLPAHEWSDSHAREARRSLPTCQSCHPDGDVCLKCHSAREGLIVNPHPRDWDEMKDYLDGASGGKTCRRCH